MPGTKLLLALGVLLVQLSANNCTEFGFDISSRCCCTANCCSEALEGEFLYIGDDTYQSTFTGQTIRRTGWSADYRFIRCACTLIEGSYRRSKDSTVHCIFPPSPQG